MLELITLVVLTLLYAFCKAHADAGYKIVSQPKADGEEGEVTLTTELRDSLYWHFWQRSGYWAFGAMGMAVAMQFDTFSALPGTLVVPLPFKAIGVLFAAWLFAQPFFEAFRSKIIYGKWYAPWTRSMSVELLSDSARAWLSTNFLPVLWRQVRFEGAWAYLYDATRLTVGIWLYLKIAV